MNDSIAIILYGNIRYDGRVQKEINTLKLNGKKVILFISDFDKDDKLENYNFQIEVIENKFKIKSSIFTILNMLFFSITIYKKLKNKKVSYIHCNDLNTLILAKYFSKIGKVIFDAHELYPESQENNLKKLFWNIIEKINLKYVYKIIQPEINRKKYFMKKYNLEEKKLILIENFPLNNLKVSQKNYFEEKYNFNKKDKNIALYIGMIMRKRNILEIIEAIKENEKIVLFCIGKCTEKDYLNEIKNYLKQNNLTNRIFLKEAIPQKEVMKATMSSDISFVFYQNVNLNNYYCASNKLYECLNSGLKIITNDYPGIMTVTKDIPNVFNVKEITPNEIKKGIDKILKVEKIRKTNFYWEKQEKNFLKIYSD